MITTTMNTPLVIDGYVRLSRDDNKRNYSSIENQKLIIQKYAEDNNMIIRHIYEDDGISGYSFNRPDFQKMMANLDTIDVIVAKDDCVNIELNSESLENTGFCDVSSVF